MILFKGTHHLLCFLALVCMPFSGRAQDMKTIIPESKTVKKGVLKNGMTYYIGKTAKNEKAGFYIIQPTGSLVEREGEYGLAHFVEHLVFRGTKNYKRQEIISRIREMGAQFGPDLNAGTGFEITYYGFKNIPLWNDQVSTDCLLMLRDMMYDAEFNDSDVEQERNVIIEEKRYRQETNEEYADTPFSRPIIGDSCTILHCSLQTIRDFYHRWYQPQIQAVVAIGSFEVEQMYEKIRNVFEPVPAGTTTVPVRVMLPTFNGPRVFIKQAFLSDNETSIHLSVRQNNLVDRLKNTLDSALPELSVSKINNPIIEIFERLYGHDISCLTSYRKDIDNVPILQFDIWSDKYNAKELLSHSLQTIRSIADHGIPKEIAANYRVKQSNISEDEELLLESNDSVVAYPSNIFNKCSSNFLYGTPIVDVDVERKVSSYLENKYGMEDFHKLFRQMVYASSPTLSISVPKNCVIPKDEIQEVITDVYKASVEPIQLPSKKEGTGKVEELQIKVSEPIPGRIVSESMLQDGRVCKIGLSNGVTVLMHQIDSLERIAMRKTAGAEYNSIYAYREGGIDDYSDELEMRYIYHDDIEEKFKEFYHRLTDYEITLEDSIRLAGQWKNEYDSQKNKVLNQFKKAFFVPTIGTGKIVHDSVMTADDFRRIRESRKAFKSNYNGMVVAIDYVEQKDALMPLMLKYIGGLPYKDEPVVAEDVDNYIKKDSILVEPSSDPKASYFSLILFQDQELAFTAENYMLNKALESVLSTAVTNKIRLQNGDVYTPYVSSVIDVQPIARQTYRIILTFAHGKSDKIEHDVKQLLQDMAYGDAINQQMIDDHITSIYASDGIYPQGGEAYLQLQKIRNNGVVVDTRIMKLEKVITLERVRAFLRSLLEHGHYYEYKNISLNKILDTNEKN